MSLSELIVVLLVALLAFGPKRLPEIAYGIGRMVQWFIGMRQKIASEISQHMRQIELQHNEAKAKAAEQTAEQAKPKE